MKERLMLLILLVGFIAMPAAAQEEPAVVAEEVAPEAVAADPEAVVAEQVVAEAPVVVEAKNKICPVSKETVGKMGDPFVVEHEGKKYNLCCSMCAKDFNADPAKYSAIAEEEIANQAAEPATDEATADEATADEAATEAAE